MSRWSLRPIDIWPGERNPYTVPSPFTAPWSHTMKVLDRELSHLGASNVVLMIDVPGADIRLDGDLRANARRRSPAVILAFDTKDRGPLKYPCDKFSKWEDNVRAIVLGLEALRKVERYGIAGRGEQYRGWSALPPGLAMGAPMSKNDAARVLADLAGEAWFGEDLAGVIERLVDGIDEEISGAYRYAAKAHHPDTGDEPDADLFQRATEARDVLTGATR